MRKRQPNMPDPLSELLRRNDPAGDLPTEPNPARRAALLTRCAEENVSALSPVVPSGRRWRTAAVGALALSACAALLYFSTRPTPPIPIAVARETVPIIPQRPTKVLPTPGTVQKQTERKRLAVAIKPTSRRIQQTQQARLSLVIHRPQRRSHTIPRASTSPKTPATSPVLAPEPVTERVILIADSTSAEKPSRPASVTIVSSDAGQGVIVSRPSDSHERNF